jgi:hypothetical protein
MSCTDYRLQIDRQARVSGPQTDPELERIRAHARSCPGCAAYLDGVELVERRLLDLPELEPSPELSVRVMERLSRQAGERTSEPEPATGLVTPLVQQLLLNLGFLLACVGLLAGIGSDFPANLLREIGLSTNLLLRLSERVPFDPTGMIVAVGCLLVVLAIMAGPRADPVRSRVDR